MAQVAHFENARGLLDAQRGQRLAVDVLHRDGRGLLVLHEIVDADDARVGELEAAARLALEVVERGGIEVDRVGQELERHLALEPLVLRQPDDAHAAAAQDAPQDIAAENALPRFEPTNGGLETEIVGNGT